MDKIYIKNGTVLHENIFKQANVIINDGKIEKILDSSDDPSKSESMDVYDAKGNYVVPGFIDVHTHGAINIDVNAATADELEKLGEFFATQGTTSWQCSILTDTKEQTLWSIDQVNKYFDKERNGAALIGIHLEGPFLSSEYKGSMPEHLLSQGDVELIKEYQEIANGKVRYITVAPEVKGVLESIEEIRDLGIVVSLGHSGASYDTSMEAIKYGASSITHTFNAMKLSHQHFPAIAGAALESEVYTELICDGLHVHPAMVRLLLKTKGYDKVVAITDSIMATGLPDGRYKLGVNDIVVTNGDAKLASADVRAGSTLTSVQSVKNLVDYTSAPLENILKLWTENPAKMLGIDDTKGSIEKAKDADIVILSEDYSVVDTFVKGRKQELK